jgi:hypothetical protein
MIPDLTTIVDPIAVIPLVWALAGLLATRLLAPPPGDQTEPESARDAAAPALRPAA